MKITLVIGFTLSLMGCSLLHAEDAAPLGDQPVTIVKPPSITLKEKISDGEGYKTPRPPKRNFDEKSLDLVNDEDHSPRGEPILNLSDPAIFSQIQSIDKTEHISGKHHWHKFNAWDYCHFYEGGKNWYGWRTGETFHWVLYFNNHLWWHDPFAERWLYFYKGYWWWQGGKDLQDTQVYLEDGHYHVCAPDGVLGEDLWTNGKKDVVTEPFKKEPTREPLTDSPGHDGHGTGLGGGLNSNRFGN
jgi:hypothetical protein